MRGYRDSFRLLLTFAQHRTGKAPSQLDLADLDGTLIAAFLDHLERDRHNSARTRNTRMAAIRSFFRFASYREPADSALSTAPPHPARRPVATARPTRSSPSWSRCDYPG